MRAPRWLDAGAVFAVAFAARTGIVLASGGLLGNYGYDASVYYAAGSALTHGKVPYRDFILLHPPAVSLVLAPFAALGNLTTDHTGFVVANIAFCALGAVNAVLVMRICAAVGISRVAGLVGAAFYALYFWSVGAEFSTRLEPLGNFFFLVGLWAVVTAVRAGGRRWYVLAGLALGAAVSTKIWWIAPAVVVLVWTAGRLRRWREPLAVLAGLSAAVVAIDAPFAVLAGRDMWRMVITEQLGRNETSVSVLTRMETITGVDRAHLHGGAALVATALIAAAFLAVCTSACTAPGPIGGFGRLSAALALTQLAVLAAAPSWFDFYADYLTVPVALTLAAAASARPVARRIPALAADRAIAVAVTIVCLATVIDLGLGRDRVVTPMPSRRLAAAVAGQHCVVADSPMALIAMNALGRSFAAGCRDWVDVTGRTYAPDVAGVRRYGRPLSREANPAWQRLLRDYLLSGNAVIIIRPGGTAPDARTWAAVRRGGALVRAGSYVVYRVIHPIG